MRAAFVVAVCGFGPALEGGTAAQGADEAPARVRLDPSETPKGRARIRLWDDRPGAVSRSAPGFPRVGQEGPATAEQAATSKGRVRLENLERPAPSEIDQSGPAELRGGALVVDRQIPLDEPGDVVVGARAATNPRDFEPSPFDPSDFELGSSYVDVDVDRRAAAKKAADAIAEREALHREAARRDAEAREAQYQAALERAAAVHAALQREEEQRATLQRETREREEREQAASEHEALRLVELQREAEERETGLLQAVRIDPVDPLAPSPETLPPAPDDVQFVNPLLTDTYIGQVRLVEPTAPGSLEPPNDAAVYFPEYPILDNPDHVLRWIADPPGPRDYVFYHNPLYFEDANLERCGIDRGCGSQSFLSAAHFFGTLPILPYKIGSQGPCDCVPAKPFCGPCGRYSCKDNFVGPTSTRGAVYQALAVTGLVFIIP
jgi:hypothetical protein